MPTANQNGTSPLAVGNGGYTFLTAVNGSDAGTAIPVRNPLTGQVYLNGVIPFNDPSVSPFAVGVLKALPNPNVTGAPLGNNYASLPAGTLVDDKGDVRVDGVFGAKTTAFVRYSQHQGNILSPPVIQGSAGGNSNGFVTIFNQQIAGGVTHNFTQNSILDARFAFTRTDGGKSPFGGNLPSLETGIVGLPTNPLTTRSLNVQSVAIYSQFGNLGSNPQFQNPYLYDPKINYTWIHGRSTYKAGYEYQAIFTAINDFNPSFGQDTYNGNFSYNGASSTTLSAADTGTKEAAALSDFIFGARDTYQLNNFVIVNLNQRMHYFYLQDDIRFTSKLTVNVGMRYELVTPQWESNNLLSNFDPTTNQLITAKPGSLYNRALVNMPKLDFAPRFGLAYSIDDKTVVRAGYGLGFAQFNREGGENLLVYNLPAVVNTNVVQAPLNANPGVTGTQPRLAVCTAGQLGASYNPANPTPCFRTSTQGYPTNLASPSNVTAASNLLTQARYLPKNLPTGYVQSWHLTVQREIGHANTLEVAYVGEHGVKLQVLADYNQAASSAVTATCNTTTQSGCLPVASRRPIPTFTTIEETLPQGFLSYNALQTKFEHRTGHGLYILNSFTWSHAIDNASGHLDTNAGDNSRINLANALGERGASGYNQPLNETLSLVYDLPYGKGRSFGATAPLALQEVLGGWQLTLINDMNSGSPVNVIYSPTSAQQVSTILNIRPNQNGVAVLPKSQRTKTANNQGLNAFNLNAFSLPTPNQTYGNEGRNSIRFDPFYQADLGLHKQFAIYRDRVNFDFRAEAFNVLNKVNYAIPSSTTYSPGSSTFGVVTAASTFPARVLQFAGKFIF